MAEGIIINRRLESVDPGLRDVLLAILEEIEKQQRERVTKDEFIDLKQIVAELAEAQKRTATEDYAKEKGIDIIWSYELGGL